MPRKRGRHVGDRLRFFLRLTNLSVIALYYLDEEMIAGTVPHSGQRSAVARRSYPHARQKPGFAGTRHDTFRQRRSIGRIAKSAVIRQ